MKNTTPWERIAFSYEEGKAVQGTIIAKIKGGYEVTIDELVAFLPMSKADIRPVMNPATLIGLTSDFEVLSVDICNNSIVVGRRALLQKSFEAKSAEAWRSVKLNNTYKGRIISKNKDLLFVDIGGLVGVLPHRSINRGRGLSKAALNELWGKEIDVTVSNCDIERKRVRFTAAIEL